ncbi:hypothetical protein HYT92_02540 [Candidatus Pacearchaeota archaeon]|nr:hypothetical protein [Candidatus Pacearchaeota archaeon]
MAQISLEGIGKLESLHRTEFYELITGQKCEFRFGSTEIPSWKQNVRPDNMNQVMDAVQKFEKRHGNEGYYRGHVDRIREAFNAKNYDSFQQEIGELLVSIEWD